MSYINKFFKWIFFSTFGVYPDHKSIIGKYGENLALKHLRKKGFFLWDRNWKIRSGEIDLTGRIKETLIVVEVKTRVINTSNYYENDYLDQNLASLNFSDTKKIKVEFLANLYQQETRSRQSRERVRNYRIDLVAIEIKLICGFIPVRSSILHYENI